jgi:tetratricopeptide (TPR) repeat protein
MKSKMKIHLSLFLFLFLHIKSSDVIAQSCNCQEYDNLKSEYENSDNGYNSYIKKLRINTTTICKAKAEEWLADEYLSTNSFDTAELHLLNAEKLYKQSNCGDSTLLNTYKIWAALYYTKGDFAKAQEYAFKMLHSAEAAGNLYEQANSYTMISQLLNQMGQADKGIIYARSAIPFIKTIEQPSKQADIIAKISKRYLWHFQDTKTITSLDSSELFSLQQLVIARKINKTSSIAFAFANLEGIAWERGDLKKALQLLDSSFLYTDTSNYDNLGTNYYDKADILIELKQYAEAKKMADSCLYYRLKAGNPAFIAEGYEIMARVGQESGNYEMAFENKEKERAITDSIRNTDKAKIVNELEQKYNKAKNEKTIKELAQEKRIYLLLALAGLFALAGLIFFIRQQSLKNKQKILETEQRLNRARMNPHFFFNALSSLQSFALEGNDGKSIATNLSKFSHIMRETLESTYKEYVTIEQENDFLQEYLELQKIRFPQKFTYEITINDTIEPEDLLIPSMILQPFIENSIEHGFAGIDYAGHIAISFEKEGSDLQVKIIDTGKGLSTIAKQESEHISRASQIIKDRIYLLNIKLKTKASFTIDNNKNEKGVTVFIKLPLLYKQNMKS